MNELLEVKNLCVDFTTLEGVVNAVEDVTWNLYKGHNVGVVGESGCGKSVMSQAILRILDSNGRISKGEIIFHQDVSGVEKIVPITKLAEKSEELKQVRGKGISMIFQEPMTSFCPVYTIGQQITESLMMHRGLTKSEARTEGIELLKKVEISNPAQRFDEYPDQLSGGMRQRAMIAMALGNYPQILIADEPTTALDVTIQAQVMELLKSLQGKFGMTIIIISHNLRIIAELSETAIVMYLGRIVEIGPAREIFERALHPYTRALIHSIPRLNSKPDEKLSYIEGDIPNVYNRPKGCRFHPRCPEMIAGVCDQYVPKKTQISEAHAVECHLYGGEVISDGK
jgi:peptide/nickel transport system ATP-binding protein